MISYVDGRSVESPSGRQDGPDFDSSENSDRDSGKKNPLTDAVETADV